MHQLTVEVERLSSKKTKDACVEFAHLTGGVKLIAKIPLACPLMEEGDLHRLGHSFRHIGSGIF